MNATSTLEQVAIRDVMHAGLIHCVPSTPMSKVAAIMAAHRIHSVVVARDDDTSPGWGVVSDLDVAAALVTRPLAEQSAAGSAATPGILISETESVLRAAQLMTKYGVSHLIAVAEGTDRPVGVISTLDVADAAASST